MIFPLALPVLHVVLNGAPQRSYRQPYLQRGRVMVPVAMLDAMAASSETSGGSVIARRGDRFAQVRVIDGFVAIGPLLRALGDVVRYDPKRQTLYITSPNVPLATPTPFNRAVPQATPRSIFTPTPPVTPRPVVSGKPVPRRTPPPVTVKAPGTPPPAPRRL